MPYFSIIIPVCNVAPYLRECLDSVLAQTFTDWEAICVDDGSTDESGAILDEYAAKDNRFKVSHQANVGVSCTRQAGLNLAHGQYIVWADPDDFVEIDFLRSFHNAIMASGADFVWCDCYEDKDGITKYSVQAAPLDPLKYVNSILEGQIWASLWNKAISNEFIKRNKISFPDQGCEIMEDVCFLIRLMDKYPTMHYVSCTHYHYKMDGTSLTRGGQNGDEYFDRLVKSEIYVQNTIAESVLPLNCDRIKSKRKLQIKFMMYGNPLVSDEMFYRTFKDVRNLYGLNVSMWHKIMYLVAMKGFRREIIFVLMMVRKVRNAGRFY